MALRLMDFVTESKVEDEKVLYKDGPQVQDRVGTNERPLFEVLKENKDRKDAEFHEKFKHRPPKALDDDETEFLESVEMHKRELERQQKEEDAEQLINFQAALASRTISADEPRVLSHQQLEHQEAPLKNKRPAPARALPISVKIMPLPKRIKSEPAVSNVQSTKNVEQEVVVMVPESKGDGAENLNQTAILQTGLLGLGSYGDETDEDED